MKNFLYMDRATGELFREKSNNIARYTVFNDYYATSLCKQASQMFFVDFGANAFVLAGAFYDKYALVTIEDFNKDKCNSWKTDIKDRYDRMFSSVFQYPYAIAEKARDMFSLREVPLYFTPNKTTLGEDLPNVESLDFKEFESRLCSKDVLSAKQIIELMCALTDEERVELKDHLTRETDRIVSNDYVPEIRAYPSYEFPIRVKVYGTDDSTWSKCYATYEEALEAVSRVSVDSLGEEFIFTN